MKFVDLPVAPLTAKILTTQYGGAPIQPPWKDILYKHLWYQCPDLRNQTGRIKSILTDNIQIEVPDDLAIHLQEFGYQVGYYLYSLHVDEMSKFAFAQKATGITPAMTAIRKYREIHDVTEDDFPLDTAYKRWQRFILAKKRRKLRKNEGRKRVKVSELFGGSIPKRGIKLKTHIARTIRKNIHRFVLQDGTPDERLLKKAIIYFEYEDGAYEISELCSQHDLTRSTIYYHIESFRRLIQDEEIVQS